MSPRPTPRMFKAVSCFLALASVGALAGCPAGAESVSPPQYDFYFPTGFAISPDEKYLFVLSANSDLRYSAGAMLVIDLAQVDAVADAWRDSGTAPAECHNPPPPNGDGGPSVIPTRPTILACPSSDGNGHPTPAANPFVISGSSVQVGSFGVNAVTETLLADDGTPSSIVRVFSTIRGDPSITWADFDEGAVKLGCGGLGAFPRCDEAHRLAVYRNDATIPSLPAEPFGIALDPVGEHGFVTHLTTGVVTLMYAPHALGSTPALLDANTGLWTQSNQTGAFGASGVAVRRPGDPLGLVYVTSNAEARVSMVHAVDMGVGGNGLPRASLARTGSFLFYGLETSGDGGDARSLAFSPDGNSGYIINRNPPALYTFDTSVDVSGAPKNLQIGTVELCDQVANLSVADFGEGLRIAMPCFTTGQLLVVDPDGQRIVGVEDAGRGPNGIAASPLHKKIYVGNYAEDTIMVIDATPGSIWQNRVVLRIGNFRIVENQST